MSGVNVRIEISFRGIWIHFGSIGRYGLSGRLLTGRMATDNDKKDKAE